MGALILVSNVILGALVLWLAVEAVVSVRRSSEARLPAPPRAAQGPARPPAGLDGASADPFLGGCPETLCPTAGTSALCRRFDHPPVPLPGQEGGEKAKYGGHPRAPGSGASPLCAPRPVHGQGFASQPQIQDTGDTPV